MKNRLKLYQHQAGLDDNDLLHEDELYLPQEKKAFNAYENKKYKKAFDLYNNLLKKIRQSEPDNLEKLLDIQYSCLDCSYQYSHQSWDDFIKEMKELEKLAQNSKSSAFANRFNLLIDSVKVPYNKFLYEYAYAFNYLYKESKQKFNKQELALDALKNNVEQAKKLFNLLIGAVKETIELERVQGKTASATATMGVFEGSSLVTVDMLADFIGQLEQEQKEIESYLLTLKPASQKSSSSICSSSSSNLKNNKKKRILEEDNDEENNLPLDDDSDDEILNTDTAGSKRSKQSDISSSSSTKKAEDNIDNDEDTEDDEDDQLLLDKHPHESKNESRLPQVSHSKQSFLSNRSYSGISLADLNLSAGTNDHNSSFKRATIRSHISCNKFFSGSQQTATSSCSSTVSLSGNSQESSTRSASSSTSPFSLTARTTNFYLSNSSSRSSDDSSFCSSVSSTKDNSSGSTNTSLSSLSSSSSSSRSVETVRLSASDLYRDFKNEALTSFFDMIKEDISPAVVRQLFYHAAKSLIIAFKGSSENEKKIFHPIIYKLLMCQYLFIDKSSNVLENSPNKNIIKTMCTAICTEEEAKELQEELQLELQTKQNTLMNSSSFFNTIPPNKEFLRAQLQDAVKDLRQLGYETFKARLGIFSYEFGMGFNLASRDRIRIEKVNGNELATPLIEFANKQGNQRASDWVKKKENYNKKMTVGKK